MLAPRRGEFDPRELASVRNLLVQARLDRATTTCGWPPLRSAYRRTKSLKRYLRYPNEGVNSHGTVTYAL